MRKYWDSFSVSIQYYSETPPRPLETSKIENLTTIINNFQPLTFVANLSILVDVCRGGDPGLPE